MANAFDFDINIHGARVVPAKTPLCPACLSDGEIDANIKALKDDLDAAGVKMKSMSLYSSNFARASTATVGIFVAMNLSILASAARSCPS